ncbi:MAG: 30S ribosomal protein S7 [Chloroflexi bacterium RBG_16_48_7]|nr:MAG: 30S ribosomal protein S7 [Chloroflexi bacterium RBG_16_48_7]
MPRRSKVPKREILPDPKYGSQVLTMFINKMMMMGKKATSQGIIYDSFDIIEKQTKKSPMDVFEEALKNATPLLQVKARRVGGATYQVPIEVPAQRGMMMAMRWLVANSRERSGHSMAEKLAAELIGASQGEGATIKKKQEVHKMAEANRAFSHFRW